MSRPTRPMRRAQMQSAATTVAWKRQRNAADKLFSKIVRSAGQCKKCGSRSQLECAHIMVRGHNWTRCDLANAVCLCHDCHHHFTTASRAEWARWVNVTFGAGHYERMFNQAHAPQSEPNAQFWGRTHTKLKALWAEQETHQ